MKPEFPSGTVTFLFTDIEGSTRLAQQVPERWEELRLRHHTILQSAVEACQGHVFQVIGDAFCVAFHTAGEALRAAIQSQNDLKSEKWGGTPILVRMGLHTGKAEVQADGQYQGYLSMSCVQRIMSLAYGGQILVSNPCAELLRGDLPEGADLLDLQEHRLKGLLNPEHLWQVISPGLRRDFPPLQSLNAIPNNLPVQLTSFIGREKEIIELKQALTRQHLITLTGVGGTGKTRLALQVTAEVLEAFPQGVWFVEFAPISDPALVPRNLADLLGLRESGEGQSIQDLICAYFQSRKALVVFDNCEHLIEACARFADLLLRACKDLKILATSREALGIEGELAWQVPSLTLPDVGALPEPGQLSQYEAVRLFIDRAALVQPHFTVTRENAPALAQVCLRLDGIPLAIELAAARTNVLTVEQIAGRLDDRFRLLTGGARTALPRQQTLRAAIDWSYNLLSEPERSLFRRLAVFKGGWSLEAAESVCSGEALEANLVLDLMAQLVKKSLLSVAEEGGEARYAMLETVHQYARERLFESAETAFLRDRHLDFFMRMAEQGFEELTGPNDVTWIERLTRENDNFRSALSWSLETGGGDAQKALQLSGALQDYWDVRGYFTEGQQWTGQALQKSSATPSGQRCRALIGIGLLSIRLSRYEEARFFLGEALELVRQLNIPALIILALGHCSNVTQDQAEAMQQVRENIALARETRHPYNLGETLIDWAYRYANDAQERNRYIREAYEIAESLGNARLRAYALMGYCDIEMGRGNYGSATSMAQKALALNQALKDRHYSAHDLLLLGRISSDQADYAAAAQFEEQSLQIFHDLSDRGCSSRALFHLGWNASLAGQFDRAVDWFEQCLSLMRQFGGDNTMLPMTILALCGLGRTALMQGDFPKARERFLEALQASRDFKQSAQWLIFCLEGVSGLPELPAEKAAQLLGKAQATRESEALVRPVSERELVEPVLARLEAQLGKEAFEAAYAAGKSLEFAQAVELAMQVLQGS